MNKKIVLIYPNFSPPVIYSKSKEGIRVNPSVPSGLIALGSFLDKCGYKIEIIDRRVEGNCINKILAASKDALLVGMSIMTPQIEDSIKIAKALKEHYPKLPVVVGDSHPTLFPIQTCEDELIDFVVYGEGEETLLELVRKIEAKTQAFSKIKGLCWKRDGKVIANEKRPFLDVDTLPSYNFDLVDMDFYIKGYSQYDNRPIKKASIEFSRGCPHRCGFCINAIKGRFWRCKNPEKVVQEIKDLVEKYSINHI
ncbi:B12-binding domain-containing radical SAM protein, partial [Nanoarchaeota archaeon]